MSCLYDHVCVYHLCMCWGWVVPCCLVCERNRHVGECGGPGLPCMQGGHRATHLSGCLVAHGSQHTLLNSKDTVVIRPNGGPYVNRCSCGRTAWRPACACRVLILSMPAGLSGSGGAQLSVSACILLELRVWGWLVPRGPWGKESCASTGMGTGLVHRGQAECKTACSDVVPLHPCAAHRRRREG